MHVTFDFATKAMVTAISDKRYGEARYWNAVMTTLFPDTETTTEKTTTRKYTKKTTRNRRKPLSAETRKRMALAAQKRWAKKTTENTQS